MNIYLQLLTTLFPPSKYLTTYIKIVTRARLRSSNRKDAKALFDYTEKHHIILKSYRLGGNDDKDNFAFLTAREHYICHKLLIFISKGTNLYPLSLYAYRAVMIKSASHLGKRRIITSHDYEFIRKYLADNVAVLICEHCGLEVKGIGNYVRWHGDNCKTIKNRVSPTKYCNVCNKDVEATSFYLWHGEKCIGDTPREKLPTKQCEHCLGVFSTANFTQYHGDNCKLVKSRTYKEKTFITCEHCGKSIRPWIYKKQHGDNCKVNKPYPTKHCEICDKMIRANTFKRHLLKHAHDKPPCTAPKGDIEGTFICEHCNKTINGMANYVRWHGDNCKLVKPNNINTKTYGCEHCGKILKSKANFIKWHGDNCHIVKPKETKEKLYSCKHCGIKCSHEEFISKHGQKCKNKPARQQHTKYCEHCKQYVGVSGFARYHGDNCKVVKEREPLKTKTCPYCNKNVAIGSAYNKHVTFCKDYIPKKFRSKSEIALDAPMFDCEYCGQQIRSKGNLLKHIKAKHTEKHKY